MSSSNYFNNKIYAICIKKIVEKNNLLYAAQNDETHRIASKIEHEIFNDSKEERHARSNEPILKSVRSKLNEI